PPARAVQLGLLKSNQQTSDSAFAQLDFISVSPDGRWVAGGGADGFGAAVWNAADGRLAIQLVTNDNAQVIFSLDGQTLATTTPRECVLWQPGSWVVKRRLALANPSDAGAPAIALSPDGNSLATTWGPTQIQLLDTHTGKQLATLGAPILGQNTLSILFSR